MASRNVITSPPPAAPAPPGPRSLRAWLKGPPRIPQHVLARKVGVNQSLISMLVTGDRLPGGQLALRLARVTGIPIEALLHPPRRRKRPPGRAA